MDGVDSVEYCCDSPRLAWNGDPDAPGITCESCGYIVAELGGVVIYRDDDVRKKSETNVNTGPAVQQRQSSLFD